MTRNLLKLLPLSCALIFFGSASGFTDSFRTECQPGNGIIAVGGASCSGSSVYGTVTSQAYVNGTMLGGSTFLIETPTEGSPYGYNARVLAVLEEQMQAAYEGYSTGIMTVSLPVEGEIMENGFWNQSIRLTIGVAGSQQDPREPSYTDSWDWYFSDTQSIAGTYEHALNIPFSQDFYFYTSLQIDGASDPNHAASGYADFLNTVEVKITRITAAGGIEVPLSNLQSSRDFTGASAAVPEPTTLILFGTGLGVLWLAAERKRK